MRQNLLRRYRSVLISSGGVLGLFIIGLFLHGVMPGVFVTITDPLFTLSTRVQEGVGHTAIGLFSGVHLAEENQYLKRQVQILEAQVIAQDEREKTYRILLDRFELSNEPEGVLGEVVAWPPLIPYDMLLIRIPEEKTKVGMLALSYDIVPVGEVSRVYGTHAEITLFSSPGYETQVWIGEARIGGVLVGQGGGTMSITLPLHTPLSVGDRVYLPYRGGTVIGNIGEKKEDVSSGIVTFSIRQDLHPFSSSWVYVVENPQYHVSPPNLLPNE